MNRTKIGNFNIDLTLLGGQALNWNLIDGWYYGSTSTTAFKVRLEGDELVWQTYPKRNDFDAIKRYFDFDTDFRKLIKKLPDDPYIKKSVDRFGVIRILRQEFEDALIGFISSSNKSIKGIRFSISLLSKYYGERIDVDGQEYYLLPKLERLAGLTVEDLLKTKLGFRAKYLHDASLKYVNGELDIQGKSEEDSRDTLKKLNGVGDKVADCVLVYGLGFQDVFPLDVWGKRVLINHYGLNPKMKYEEMREWIKKYFNGYASLAGQYLFEDIRKNKGILV